MIEQITIDPAHPNYVTVDIDDRETQGRRVALVAIDCQMCGGGNCGMDWKAFFLAGIQTCQTGQFRRAPLDQAFAIQFYKE